jgi:hypothetical protein
MKAIIEPLVQFTKIQSKVPSTVTAGPSFIFRGQVILTGELGESCGWPLAAGYGRFYANEGGEPYAYAGPHGSQGLLITVSLWDAIY